MMTKNLFKKIVLVLLFITFFLTAFFLRIYKITELPSGFSQDEMSQGYIAYSILKTGKDEWGVRYPLILRAFGDFRLPLYTYLIIPTVSVLGLNELAVRLPGVIFGSLAVIIVYFLAKELFADNLIAFWALFFLLISPWHLSLSRVGLEMSLNTFFLPLGLWLFFKGLKTPVFMILSGLILGLNMLTCHSARFFTPMVVFLLLYFFKRSFLKTKYRWFFLIFIAAFFCLSYLPLLGKGSTRIINTSLLNQPDNWQRLLYRQSEEKNLGLSATLGFIFNNKITYLVRQFVKNYLEYLSFGFLFINGVLEATYGMIPETGVMYLFELPLLVFGLLAAFKTKDKKLFFLLLCLLLAPMPASFTQGGRSGNRAVTMLPFLQIFTAVGLVEFWRLFGNRVKLKKTFAYLFVVIVLFSFLNFVRNYFFYGPIVNSQNMAYGWRQVSQFLADYQPEKILISKHFSEPQIAVAFYWQIDPNLVQQDAKNWLKYEQMGFSFVDQLPKYALGKFEFRNFDFPKDKKIPNAIFIGRQEDFGAVTGVNVLKTVSYPGLDKKVAFEIIKF